jgi:hypothetical protein
MNGDTMTFKDGITHLTSQKNDLISEEKTHIRMKKTFMDFFAYKNKEGNDIFKMNLNFNQKKVLSLRDKNFYS